MRLAKWFGARGPIPNSCTKWYGPGVETTIHKFDLKPGGS